MSVSQFANIKKIDSDVDANDNMIRFRSDVVRELTEIRTIVNNPNLLATRELANIVTGMIAGTGLTMASTRLDKLGASNGKGDVTLSVAPYTYAPYTHKLLSSTHDDTTAGSPVRGDIITAQGATPLWTRLAKGSLNQSLLMGADEPVWTTLTPAIVGAASGTGTANFLAKCTNAIGPVYGDSIIQQHATSSFIGINVAPLSALHVKGTSSVAAVAAANILTADGTFDSSTGWTVPADWAIGSSVATHATGSTGVLSGTSSATSTTTVYQVVFTVAVTTAGSGFTVSLGGRDAGTTFTTAGTKTIYILPKAGTGTLSFTPGAGGTFVGTIDTVEIHVVTASTPEAYLQASDAGTSLCGIRSYNDGRKLGIGYLSGQSTLAGTFFTGLGQGCGISDVTGDFSGFGYRCGFANTTGEFTGFGSLSGYSNTTGEFTGFGNGCGFSNTIGYFTGVGHACGYLNTSGGFTGVGRACGYSNTTGTFSGLGQNCGASNQTGFFTGVGYGCGYSNTTTGFVGLGYYAGYYETGGGFFVDNINRTTEALGRTHSLIYGIFNAVPASQLLSCNGILQAQIYGAATNTVQNILRTRHNSSGTVAAGYGSSLLNQLKSSTTVDQDASAIVTTWTDPTHGATYSKLAFQTAVASTLTERFAFGQTEAVFNDGGLDYDLRVEGGTDANLLVADASADMVGFGTPTPTAKVDINSDIIRLRTAKTPASAAAAGNAGDICWDADYVYVCVAASTWKRAAIATW